MIIISMIIIYMNIMIISIENFIAGNPKFVAGAHIGKVSARLKLCNEQNFGKKIHRVVGQKVELGKNEFLVVIT